jgi:peptidoglycan/LPS O-acetylase OafA/YrhL
LIISAINARASFAAALNARWVRYLGRLSYSFYLWQQPLLWTKTWGEDRPWFACWPQNLIFACAAALVSYHCIERPILSWRDKHSQRAVPAA